MNNKKYSTCKLALVVVNWLPMSGNLIYFYTLVDAEEEKGEKIGI